MAKHALQIVPTLVQLVRLSRHMAYPMMLLKSRLVVLSMVFKPLRARWARVRTLLLMSPFLVMRGGALDRNNRPFVLTFREQGFIMIFRCEPIVACVTLRILILMPARNYRSGS